MKVLFVVRSPADRIYSNYRFSYATYQRFSHFDETVMIGMDEGSKFSELRKMIVNGTEMKDMIAYFYNHKYEGKSAIGSLFLHSMYVFSISHFISILGKENVMVVTSDSLDVRDPTTLYDTLNRAFRFIGVCPEPIPNLVPSLSARNHIPRESQISQDIFYKIGRFFEPFNDLLANVTGLNLTDWKLKKPSSKWPQWNTVTNQSNHIMWFEKDQSKSSEKYAGKLVPHLLPNE